VLVFEWPRAGDNEAGASSVGVCHVAGGTGQDDIRSIH
jgi:hypothetical protein